MQSIFSLLSSSENNNYYSENNFIKHLQIAYDKTPNFVKLGAFTMAGLYLVKEILTLPHGPSRMHWSALVVGHRGARWLSHTSEQGAGRRQYPENTLESFLYAVDNHADGIEFDIRLIKSGEFVVFHDGFINPQVRFTAPRDKGADADDHESDNHQQSVHDDHNDNKPMKHADDEDASQITSGTSRTCTPRASAVKMTCSSSTGDVLTSASGDENAKATSAGGLFASSLAADQNQNKPTTSRQSSQPQSSTMGTKLTELQVAAESTLEKFRTIASLSRNASVAAIDAPKQQQQDDEENFEQHQGKFSFPDAPPDHDHQQENDDEQQQQQHQEQTKNTTTQQQQQQQQQEQTKNTKSKLYIDVAPQQPSSSSSSNNVPAPKENGGYVRSPYAEPAESPSLLASEMLSLNQQKAAISFDELSLHEVKQLRYIGSDRSITMPTLEETLELCEARDICRVFVEIKTYSLNPWRLWELAKTYVDFYKKHKKFMDANTTTIAFNPLVLYLIRYLEPSVAVCLLAEQSMFLEQGSRKLDQEAHRNLFFFPQPLLQLFDSLIWFFNREFFIDMIGASMYGPKHDMIEARFLDRLYTKGVCVYLWGIKSTNDIRECLKRAGVCLSCDGDYSTIKDHFAVH